MQIDSNPRLFFATHLSYGWPFSLQPLYDFTSGVKRTVLDRLLNSLMHFLWSRLSVYASKIFLHVTWYEEVTRHKNVLNAPWVERTQLNQWRPDRKRKMIKTLATIVETYWNFYYLVTSTLCCNIFKVTGGNYHRLSDEMRKRPANRV